MLKQLIGTSLCVWKQCLNPEYLGLNTTAVADNTSHAEVSHRFASAGYAWYQLNVAKVWCNKHLTRAREVLTLKFVTVPFLMQGCEVWPASENTPPTSTGVSDELSHMPLWSHLGGRGASDKCQCEGTILSLICLRGALLQEAKVARTCSTHVYRYTTA